MTMLLRVLLPLLAVTCVVSSGRRLRQTLTFGDRNTESFQTIPRRALVKPGGKITLLGNAGVPLQSCIFYLPWPRDKWGIDFSLGHASNSTDRYEYFGRGLEYGDCGMRMKRVADDDDGIIQCNVLPFGSEGPSDWEKCATTLRVTSVREKDLPVFNIEPSHNLVRLARGDSITIKCNADRPINLCHIYLPGPIFLKMDQGPDSSLPSGYRYHGRGLDKGECGATLPRVDERLTGYVVCKVGSWPETLNGKWETDSFQAITTELRTTSDLDNASNRPVINPNATSCPPLISKGVELTCLFAGKPTKCSKPQRILSVAYMDCKPGHFVQSHIIYRKSTCIRGGIWDPVPIACKPDCGKRITNKGRPNISNGKDALVGEFPWHVGIYQFAGKALLQACGGALVTPSIVVTTAHCFWDEVKQELYPTSMFKVASGKHMRDWNNVTAWVQRSDVLEIVVHKEYRGRGNSFASDIALVRLTTPVEINKVVNLICIDWNHEFDHQHIIEGNKGIVPGWGFTQTHAQSDILQYIELPYRSRDTCLNVLSVELQQLVTPDKFCAGFINESKSVCRGDSGGGLVFLEPKTNTFYLRGLVSIAFIVEQSRICNMEQYTGFTRFDDFHDWVLDTLNDDSKRRSNNNIAPFSSESNENDDDRIIFPKT